MKQLPAIFHSRRVALAMANVRSLFSICGTVQQDAPGVSTSADFTEEPNRVPTSLEIMEKSWNFSLFWDNFWKFG